jgi:hypothetical protein
MPLTLKQSHVEAYIRDPVLAVHAFWGAELDTFQKCRLRLMWFLPDFTDYGGQSAGKTEVVFFCANLRCLLLPNPAWMPPRITTVYYQNLSTARDTFWPKYDTWFDREGAELFREQFPVYRKQLGNYSRDGVLVRRLKNGSEVQLPAGDFMRDSANQASRSYNDCFADEFTKMDEVGSGLDKEILSRTRAPCFNKNHPVWANKRVLLAHAEDPLTHPSWKRVKALRRAIREGSLTDGEFTASFRDYNQEFIDKVRIDLSMVSKNRRTLTEAEFDQQMHGVWRIAGATWYSGKEMVRSVDRHLRGHWGRQEEEDIYVLGWDTAIGRTETADFSAGVVWRIRRAATDEWEPGLYQAGNRCYEVSPVWSVSFRGRSQRVMSGVVHSIHQAFQLRLIVMDPGGGGSALYERMTENVQLINNRDEKVLGICMREDQGRFPEAQPIAAFFKRKSLGLGDPWGTQFNLSDAGPVEWAHRQLRRCFNAHQIRWPARISEIPAAEMAAASTDEVANWRELSNTFKQVAAIRVLLGRDGKPALTGGNAAFVKFERRRNTKRDLAFAAVYGITGIASILGDMAYEEDEEEECI